MAFLEKLSELVQSRSSIPGYTPAQTLGTLPDVVGETNKKREPITKPLTEPQKTSAPLVNESSKASLSGNVAIQTPVNNPIRSVNKGVPRPADTKHFTKVPTNILPEPFSKMSQARNTGIVDVDGNPFINDEDLGVLAKLGYSLALEEYKGLEKTSEVYDLYSYIEKVAGVPKSVARAVDKGEAFSGEFLKDMDYKLPEGYEVKGDLCCPVEKTASTDTPYSQPTVENPYPGIIGDAGIMAGEFMANRLANSNAKAALGKSKVPVNVASLLGKARMYGNIVKAAPAVGAVTQANGAYNRYKKQDYLGAAIDGVGAVSSAAQLAPNPLAKGIGLGVSTASTVANAARDIHRYNNRPVEFRHDPAILNNPGQVPPSQNPVQLKEPLAKSGENIEKESAERPGLWANIRAKKERGGKPAKPGDEAYPDKKQWDKLTKAAVAAWQRSEGKNPEGGLNAKGRASYKRETGGTLKAPVTESNPKGERAKRQNSFCSRMCGMKSKNTGSKAQGDPDSRINKSLRKWNCKCGEEHESLYEKVACLVKEAASNDSRKRTYVGAQGKLKKEEIDSFIREIENNTGVDLDKMPVLSGERQFWRNVARAYVPKTLRQVPSRLGRLGFTLATPLMPLTGIGTITDVIASASQPPGDFYNPMTGTVNVAQKNPSVLAHEIGHYVDFEKGEAPYARGLLGGFKERRFANPILQDELNASIFAHRALKGKSKGLNAALATYLYTLPNLQSRTFKEWWNNVDKHEIDPNYIKNLPLALQGNDFTAINKALRTALNTIQKDHVDNGLFVFTKDKHDNIVPNRGHKLVANKYMELAKLLLEEENKRLLSKNSEEDTQKQSDHEKQKLNNQFIDIIKSGAATHELKSSNIKAVGYDKKEKELEVHFHSGGEYKYKDVPKSLFDRIRKAKSPGGFFHKHIKRDNPFEYEKLAQYGSSAQQTAYRTNPQINAGINNVNSNPAGQPNMMPSRASSMKNMPKADPMHIPQAANALKPTYTPEVPKLNITPQSTDLTPEHTVRELADVPLSSMTPKDHWVSGLQNILGKRPVMNQHYDPIELARDESLGESNRLAPTRASISQYTAQALLNPMMYPEPTADLPPNLYKMYLLEPKGHEVFNQAIRDHLHQYDPSWGDSFRLPIKEHDIIPVDEGAVNSVVNDHNRKVESFKGLRNEFQNKFRDYLKSRHQQEQG